MDTGEQLQLGAFQTNKKTGGPDLSELFDKLQIDVVGKENKDGDSDNGIEDSEESDEVGDVEEELAYMQDDPNLVS